MDELQPLPIIVIGSFLVGWLVAKLAAFIAGKVDSTRRDPRDARIRSLTAELRVAKSIAEKQQEQLESRTAELGDTQKLAKQRQDVVIQHEIEVNRLTTDLKSANQQVRKLQVELKERKAEHARVLARLQELETEISMVRASTTLFPDGIEAYADEDEEQPAARAGT